MSIIETKFRKGFVETPELRTNNIEYLGIDYPMYDVVNKTFVPNPTQYEEEFSNSSSFQEKEFDAIRILPHTPLLENVGLITFRGISLHTCNRDGELEYITLCVYGRKGTEYEYLGHSINAFINPIKETIADFDFDIQLFSELNGVKVPYREVYLKPLIVQIDENGNFEVEETHTRWDNMAYRTRLKLKSCDNYNVNFNPYITNLEGTHSPHVFFRYQTGTYTINDKIAHTANGDVHLNSFEKEKFKELCEISDRVFNEDDFIIDENIIDTRELNSAYSSINGEVMCSFTVVPTDFVGHNLTELRFRRGNDRYLMQNKYLQADCYNESGARVATLFSIEPKSQVAGDNNEVIFNFDDFVIKDTYKSIEFRISPSNTTRQDNVYLSFPGSSLRNSSGGGYRAKDGWILKWIQGAPENNIRDDGEIIAPSAQNNLTPDFTVIFNKNLSIKGSGMIKHLTNDDIHVTAEDKERWNNSTVELNPGSCIEIGENNTISVKTADALAYDENTVPTNKTVYLEMGYVLTDAQTYADEAVTGHRNQSGLHTSTLLQNKWNNHVDDDTIHVTADDKTAWNSKIDQSVLDERLEEIENLLFDTTSKETTRNTKDVFAKDGTGSAARLHAWDLKTTEYVGEYLTQVTIYRPTNVDYIDSSDILHNNPQWLSVECLDVDGNLLDTYFSNDKDSQKDGEDNTTTWNFNEIKIKEEYHKLRFRVTTQENVLENQPQSMKRAILCYTYTNIPDTNDWGVIEQNNTVRAGHTMYFQFKTIIKKLAIEGHIDDNTIHVTADEKTEISKITPLKTLVDGHIGDATHLTETQKTAIGKVGTLETSLNNHVGDDTHVTADEKSEIAKVTDIQSNIEELETKYNDVITILNNSLPDIETFSTLDSGTYVVKSGGKSNATGVQLSREHFTTGSIKVVEICHIDGINANDIRLCAIVFHHGEDENTPKTIDDCIFSTNTQSQVQGVGGSMCFRFNNLELPNDYEFVRFLFAKGDTVIPVHNNAETVIEARVQVLSPKEQGSGGEYAETPDDECKVFHISSTSNWYPYVRVMKTVLGYSDIVSLINRVSQLEARVNELENS